MDALDRSEPFDDPEGKFSDALLDLLFGQSARPVAGDGASAPAPPSVRNPPPRIELDADPAEYDAPEAN